MRTDTPTLTYRKDYQTPDFWIDQVQLHFQLFADHTLVETTITFRRNSDAASTDAALVLDGRELETLAVELDGVALSEGQYEITPESLIIPNVPEAFTLKTRVRIHPEANTSLEGLYQSSGMFCTQCEAEGFRKITWFLDRPDVMARYAVTLEADQAKFHVLLSNGNCVASGVLENGRHWAKWEDPFRKPSYLFALVAGNLGVLEDSFTTASGRTVALRLYSEPENVSRLHHGMASLKQAMRWDEERFGLEYDLDTYMIVAVNDFNFGAMENKGLNLFNSELVLADPESATDDDHAVIQGVIAHEYFHNWTGNRVTCRDWFQLSLKEGLTVFRDQEFSADLNSRPIKRMDDVRLLRLAQFPEDAGPMAHPVRPDSFVTINNFYTATVYEKGAEVIRMMHTLLGEANFRKGMDLYFERHDGQAVTCDDFVAAMEGASGLDLAQFRRWYEQAGTPELHVSGAHDVEARTYTLTVRQAVPDTPGQLGLGQATQAGTPGNAPDGKPPVQKQPYHLPIRLGLLDAEGSPIPLRISGTDESDVSEKVLELREESATFVFTGIAQPPVPSLLREFSAPVRLYCDYTDADLAHLMAHDPDLFNRWEAGQRLLSRGVLSQIPGWRSGQPPALSRELLGAVRTLLTQSQSSDPALIAQVVTFPDEKTLAEEMAEVDVEAIHAVRKSLIRQIAQALESELREAYRANRVSGAYEFRTDHAGCRALHNRALRYLGALETPETNGLVHRHFESAQNMTDAMGALGTLAHLDCPERESALEAFYQRWQDDALVITKWFGLQATSSLPDTLGRVKGLLRHPAFDLTNPNKARSLIGAFVRSNPIRFHEASGAGYAFLSEQVLALDPLNPQVASRLVGAFNRWKKYDAARQGKMTAELERIRNTPKLSKDVLEVVTKALG